MGLTPKQMVRENPICKWMRTRATIISGNLHMIVHVLMYRYSRIPNSLSIRFFLAAPSQTQSESLPCLRGAEPGKTAGSRRTIGEGIVMMTPRLNLMEQLMDLQGIQPYIYIYIFRISYFINYSHVWQPQVIDPETETISLAICSENIIEQSHPEP